MENKEFTPETKGASNYKRDRIKRNGKAPRKQEDYSKVVDNLVAYYNKYPTDYETAFNTPWFKVIGTPINWSEIVGFAADMGPSPKPVPKNTLPSMMVINYVPGPGIAENSEDPCNRTFAMIMADLYAKTSGANLGFNNAQLAMQMISITSIMNAIGEAQRALSCTQYWASKNANYPRAIISALGFDYDDISKNRANYVTQLNALIHAFNNMQIPSFLEIFKRQYTLASNIYLDEEDEFGQIYAFKQSGIYLYDFENFKCTFSRSWQSNMGERISYISNALFKWINNDDFYKVNGALLRAYKDAATIIIPDSTITDMIQPAKPDHILSQIMNMDITGKLVDDSLTIQQNVAKNLVYWTPYLSVNEEPVEAYVKTKFLRAFNDNPTRDDNCEMTRLCVTYGVVKSHAVDVAAGTDTTRERWGIASMQSEIVESIGIYDLDKGYDAASLATTLDTNFIYSSATSGPIYTSAMMAKIMCLQPFRYIPTILFLDGNSITDPDLGGTFEIRHTYVLGDIYNYTTLDETTLANQNRVASLSLWRPTMPTL